MRRLLTLLLSLGATCLLYAQGGKNHAVVEELREEFVMSSGDKATRKVHVRTTVHDENGASAGVFSEMTDSFRSLTSFSAAVDVRGKVVKGKMSDVKRTQLMSSSFVDDAVSCIYVPEAPYPYTVEYDYTIEYRSGVSSFPLFVPIPDYDIPVKLASYVISVPEGRDIIYKSSSEPMRSSAKGKDIYAWSFVDIPAVKQEHMMPGLLEVVPYVRACPAEFSWAGTKGSQRTWADLGRWNASLFPSDDIPQNVRDEIASITSVCSNDESRLRKVYDYLRDKTRYVSIQLGIGGYAPMSPASVSRNGYGDCKALSYYMKTLLAEIGIKSRYVTLKTGYDDLREDYAAIGQMDHAMLCVPLERDTVWVECTNPALPLGYRHSDIAGHNVLIVDEEGESRMVKVPSYEDSLKVRRTTVNLRLNQDGSALASCVYDVALSDAEPFVDIRNWDEKSRVSRLTNGFRASVESFRLLGVEDNFDGWSGDRGYVPRTVVRYEVSSKLYSKVMGNRLFVPVPVFSREMPVNRAERIHDLVIRETVTVIDEVVVSLPSGYGIESMPKFPSLSSRFLDVSTSVSEGDGTLTFRIESRLKAGRFPREAYDEYRTLVRNFNKLYESTLVLVKK